MNPQQLSFDTQRRFPDLQPHIERQFLDFHRANIHVYSLFKRFARDARANGRKHYGAKAIIERIRWHLEVDTNAGDFKINNNYTAAYARLLIEEDPSFKEFFQLRHTPGIEVV